MAEVPSDIGSASPENEPDLGFRHTGHSREIRPLQLKVRVFVETAFVFPLRQNSLEGLERAFEYHRVFHQTVAKRPQGEAFNTRQESRGPCDNQEH
jgi:hypothetical protein